MSSRLFDLKRKGGRQCLKSSKSGPVAQLGARFHGMEEVIGSIPIRSTKSFQEVGATSFPRPCRIFVANSRTFPPENLRPFPSEALPGSVVVAVLFRTTAGLRLRFAGFDLTSADPV